MSNVKILKDSSGNYIYPITHEDIVFDTDGVPVSEKYQTKNEAEEDKNAISGKIETIENNIKDINENIDTIEENISTINNNIDNIEGNIDVHFVDVDNITSVDSADGYMKDIQIIGNTVQDTSNLADIRSVGDKLENQELYKIPVLSTNKNLLCKLNKGYIINSSDGQIVSSGETNSISDFIKVKPNTSYVYNSTDKQKVLYAEYRKDKTFIKRNSSSYTVTTSSETHHIIIQRLYTDDFGQLEEGAVATPYEPYKEQKLTILSPVQLEKVGDISDKIIKKNSVWGIEKNIEKTIFNGNEKWEPAYGSKSDTFVFESSSISAIPPANKNTLAKCINNKFNLVTQNENYISEYESIAISEDGFFRLNILKSRLSTTDVNGLKQWLDENPITLIYQSSTPQFIPLPHDQQVKLRTFANKTNISFQCEIEPTLKAQVPKSIGATVNTHSEQIDNLGKELDRVKKLEESTVSTVVTDKDFTTVSETSNGYFEDVKLEGKTLVNLIENHRRSQGNINATNKGFNVTKSSGTIDYVLYNLQQPTKLDTDYTLIYTIKSNTITNSNSTYGLYADGVHGAFPSQTVSGGKLDGKIGTFSAKLRTNESQSNKNILSIAVHNSDEGGYLEVDDIMLLEGDHTQNPPSYFEGLKSVGQEVDEISVESAFINTIDNLNKHEIDSNGKVIHGDHFRMVSTEFIPVNSHTLTLNINSKFNLYNAIVFLYDANKKFISKVAFAHNVNKSEACFYIPSNCKYYKVRLMREDDLTLNTTDVSIQLVLKQDKKRILYYNNETDAWEKPILRQWDTIEKHSDGKYYYHKRSGEVVLNGSEVWSMVTGTGQPTNTNFHIYVLSGLNIAFSPNIICDKITPRFYEQDKTAVGADTESFIIGGYTTQKQLRIGCEFVSVDELKTWLQANPTTVVYQLATEEVYECTNLDLITYADETNLLVKSGVLSPKTTLKVHSNIANVITLLQEKVSMLENQCIQMFKFILSGDYQSLAYSLYPKDFTEENNDENSDI